MSALGIPPRTVAVVAAALAVIGIVGLIAGAFSSIEWIWVIALMVVAAINWRRAQQTDVPGGRSDE